MTVGTKPNLFVIGASKSGSSALHAAPPNQKTGGTAAHKVWACASPQSVTLPHPIVYGRRTLQKFPIANACSINSPCDDVAFRASV